MFVNNIIGLADDFAGEDEGLFCLNTRIDDNKQIGF
jgi:hypothetical protein